ncbi:hypothetical protein GCM10017783_08790 [Deinococcus piscis]|uniref:Glycerophosphoryl diester phosphodiesterase membrane domain-containing protein n=1 Tax=Deinococcus piscis TaxID=394230 RepID=A0ABQ3K0W2_9DEIO|nr:hypothetical protein [Deinococcus piscis]GHF99000.1 hypothetical protein GCM10017783_08790 [Deinococcus piscis]
MTHLDAPLQQAASRLSTWLGVWRILYLVFGGLGLLALLAALLYGLSAGDTLQEAGSVIWLLALPAAFIALSLWVYWSLLSWGKEWVDRSAQLALHGGDAGRLRQLDSTLGKWIMGIVWATLAFYVLGTLAAWVIIQITETPLAGEALAGLIFALLLLVGVLLVGVYFPYTALRRFLAQATARLSGQGLYLKPAADRLNTWCIVLIVLQVIYLPLSLLGGLMDADPAGMVGTLIALPIIFGLSLMYILPLLAAGRYAKALASTLDSSPAGQTGPAQSNARVSDYSQMGRLADQSEVPPGRP